MLKSLAHKVLEGGILERDEGLLIAASSGADVFELFAHAGRIREAVRGERADLCSIISAKTGACPEDCSYCSQSARSKTGVRPEPLVDKGVVIEKARAAKSLGVRRFCVVTSGRQPSGAELEKIAEMVGALGDEGLLPCATLGLLEKEGLEMLRAAGLHRYHHNIETSRRFFPEVCTTHSYDEKLKTARAARAAGLSLCSGGIFGLGEGWDDRVDMALELRALGADSVPVNFLVPVEGTPLGGREPLQPLEALKIISLFRFMLPDREIRVCGGRLQTLGELNSMVFMAGADGLLTGDCLTVAGRRPEDDLMLARAYGLSV
jgi:biotin synthase